MRTGDSGNCNARALGVTQSDSKPDELRRRVTTATPVRSAMEQGKEPSQRSFELTARECVRQWSPTHSRLFVGNFGWRMPMGLSMCAESHSQPDA